MGNGASAQPRLQRSETSGGAEGTSVSPDWKSGVDRRSQYAAHNANADVVTVSNAKVLPSSPNRVQLASVIAPRSSQHASSYAQPSPGRRGQSSPGRKNRRPLGSPRASPRLRLGISPSYQPRSRHGSHGSHGRAASDGAFISSSPQQHSPRKRPSVKQRSSRRRQGIMAVSGPASRVDKSRSPFPKAPTLERALSRTDHAPGTSSNVRTQKFHGARFLRELADELRSKNGTTDVDPDHGNLHDSLSNAETQLVSTVRLGDVPQMLSPPTTIRIRSRSHSRSPGRRVSTANPASRRPTVVLGSEAAKAVLSASRGDNLPASHRKMELSLHGQELFAAMDSPVFTDEMAARYGPAADLFTLHNNFRIDATIGTGAYGKVHRATALHGGSKFAAGDVVAVKEIHFDNMEDDSEEGTAARVWKLMAEIDLLRKCTSNYIVAFYDSYVVAGADERRLEQMWIVMEYCDMGSVSDVMEAAGGTLGVECAREIAFCALNALDYIHRVCTMIHRDVKPSNILLQYSGRCMLADFGVSASLVSRSELRSTFVGTLPYMAPETVAGKGYSSKVDIWGLGVSLIEILEGTTANHRMRKHSLLLKLLNGPALTLEEESKFPAALRGFLREMLVHNSTLRSSAEMLLRHDFLRSVVGRGNTREWLLRNPTPLSTLCRSLQQRMVSILEDKNKNSIDDFDEMYASSDSSFGPSGDFSATTTTLQGTLVGHHVLSHNTSSGTLVLHADAAADGSCSGDIYEYGR